MGLFQPRGRTWHCPLLTSMRSPSACFPSLAQSPSHHVVYQPLSSGTKDIRVLYPQGTPPAPGHQLDSMPLPTTQPGQTRVRPPHLSLWAPAICKRPPTPVCRSGEVGQAQEKAHSTAVMSLLFANLATCHLAQKKKICSSNEIVNSPEFLHYLLFLFAQSSKERS